MNSTAVLPDPWLGDPDHGPAMPDPWVRRFGPTERLAHWWTVSMFAIALLSGLAMDDDGGGPVLVVHAGSVILLVLGLTCALVLGDRHAMLTAGRRLYGFDKRDKTWLITALRHPLARHSDPAWGMFNAGQKLLAWALTASIVALIATGIQSWYVGGEGNGLHSAFAVLTVMLLCAHIFMAVVNPATRPALRGMVFGKVRRSWAATHHAEWLRDTESGGRPRKLP